MKRNRTFVFLALAVIILGVGSGLPFRQQLGPANHTMAAGSNQSGESLLQTRTPEEGIVRILQSEDTAFLQRAFDRELPSLLENLDQRPSLVWVIAEKWARLDPEGMYRHLMATGGLSRRTPRRGYSAGFADVLFKAWLERDRDGAVEAALDLDRSARHPEDSGLRIVMAHLIENDPDRARELAQRHPIAWSRAIDAYNVDNEEAMLDFVLTLPPNKFQRELADNLVREWFQDPNGGAEVWAWLNTMDEAARAELLLRQVQLVSLPREMLRALRGVVVGHPDKAVDFISSNGDALVKEFGFAGMIEWTMESLNGRARHESLENLFKHGGEEVEMNELMLAYDALPGGTLRDSAAGRVAARMVAENPLGGLEWIDSQNLRGVARKEAMQTWARRWAEHDLETLTEHLNSSDMSKDADIILASGIGRFRFPEGGKAWIQNLSHESQAVTAARMIFGNWAAKGDRQAAKAAAEEIERPAVRAAALEAIETHGK